MRGKFFKGVYVVEFLLCVIMVGEEWLMYLVWFLFRDEFVDESVDFKLDELE